MPERASAPQILYIGSYGRSGSTLLGRMLAQAPRTICVGETRYLWSRGLLDDAECGCGASFRRCSFWSAVAQEAFGGWDRVDAERLADIDRRLNGLRTLPRHLLAGGPSAADGVAREYREALSATYRAIAAVSGAKTIVEISKDPTFAAILAGTPGLQLRVLHLVRDPRAVAYSWTRRRREPSPIAGREYMPRFSPTETAAKWVAFDAGLRALRATGLPFTRLAYERLLSAPAAVLSEIASFAGIELAAELPVLEGRMTLGPHHMFSANPMRTRSGSIALSLDDEWRERLPARHYLAVSALTLTRLHAYGYPLARGRPPSSCAQGRRDELARA